MTRIKGPSVFRGKGFTLVELLVALVVSSIILGAVATLAFALSKANDAIGDSSYKQAQLRYATLRIEELLGHCKLICYAGTDDFAIWRADENNNSQINIGELVYIERGAGRDHLMLTEFSSSNNAAINLISIKARATNWWSAYSSDARFTELIPRCSNVQFSFDVYPPQSRFVNISFNLVENDIVRQYRISCKLRGWAGNLLSQGGSSNSIVSDDD